MLTKIYFPFTNTDMLSYESDINLTTDAYDSMIADNFNRNKSMMNDFTNYGFSVKNNNYYGVDYTQEKREINDCLDFSETEALVTNVNGSDVDTNFFNDALNDGRMKLLSINVNPNSIDFDVASEIKLWIGESDNINYDKTLDNKTKLSSLQGRDLLIDVEERKLKLSNCKIIQNNSSKKSPINLIIIVEKITNK